MRNDDSSFGFPSGREQKTRKTEQAKGHQNNDTAPTDLLVGCTLMTVLWLSLSKLPLFPLNDTTIYRMTIKEARCGAVFPGNEASIPILQITFPPFSVKSVHLSVNLPDFGAKLAQYGQEIYADIAHFTDIEPIRQWSEVVQTEVHTDPSTWLG